MKVVILAGGLGTRLSEETNIRPKPMVEIGGKPILWHIMKIYSAHGLNDFIVCLGYKGYMIKEYFANYFLHTSDVTFELADNKMQVHQRYSEPWRVTLVDTGDETMTGGRLRRVREYLDQDDFCCTYGDGVGNVDITALVAFHRRHGWLRVPGFVLKLQDYVDEAAVIAVPLAWGAGTKLKVIEALAMGKPLVTTKVGAGGLNLTDGTHALVRELGPDFDQAVAAVASDPARYHPMAQRDRELAWQHFSQTALTGLVAQALAAA